MKAIVYEGIKDVKVKEVSDSEIEKPDDILIRVTSATICGSDLHLTHGMIPNMPEGYVLGHESVGVVEEVGKEVTHLKKGDRVIVPFPVACGHCFYCEQDQYSQCDNSNPYGEIGGIIGYSNTFGGYRGGQAEYLRVPFANVGPRVIPEHLTDEQVLFLTDILPTAFWGVTNGGVKKGDTVAIFGSGPVGLLAQKMAWLQGASRVIAIDSLDYRLEHAKRTNHVETVNFKKQDATGEYIKEITKGGADVVIDCVGMDGEMTLLERVESFVKLQGGAMSALVMAAQAVRKAGTVSVVGVYGARYNQFPLGDFFSRNITLKMGQAPVQAFIDPLLEMISKGELDVTDIITHRMSLSDGEKAYTMFDEKKDDCIKIVLQP